MTSDGRVYCVYGYRRTQIQPDGGLGEHWWPVMWRHTTKDAHDLIDICELQAKVYRDLLAGGRPFEARVDYLEVLADRVAAVPHIASFASVWKYKADHPRIYYTAAEYRARMYDRTTVRWDPMPRYGFVAWDDDSLNTPLSSGGAMIFPPSSNLPEP